MDLFTFILSMLGIALLLFVPVTWRLASDLDGKWTAFLQGITGMVLLSISSVVHWIGQVMGVL